MVSPRSDGAVGETTLVVDSELCHGVHRDSPDAPADFTMDTPSIGRRGVHSIQAWCTPQCIPEQPGVDTCCNVVALSTCPLLPARGPGKRFDVRYVRRGTPEPRAQAMLPPAVLPVHRVHWAESSGSAQYAVQWPSGFAGGDSTRAYVALHAYLVNMPRRSAKLLDPTTGGHVRGSASVLNGSDGAVTLKVSGVPSGMEPPVDTFLQLAEGTPECIAAALSLQLGIVSAPDGAADASCASHACPPLRVEWLEQAARFRVSVGSAPGGVFLTGAWDALGLPCGALVPSDTPRVTREGAQLHPPAHSTVDLGRHFTRTPAEVARVLRCALNRHVVPFVSGGAGSGVVPPLVSVAVTRFKGAGAVDAGAPEEMHVPFPDAAAVDRASLLRHLQSAAPEGMVVEVNATAGTWEASVPGAVRAVWTWNSAAAGLLEVLGVVRPGEAHWCASGGGAACPMPAADACPSSLVWHGSHVAPPHPTRTVLRGAGGQGVMQYAVDVTVGDAGQVALRARELPRAWVHLQPVDASAPPGTLFKCPHTGEVVAAATAWGVTRLPVGTQRGEKAATVWCAPVAVPHLGVAPTNGEPPQGDPLGNSVRPQLLGMHKCGGWHWPGDLAFGGGWVRLPRPVQPLPPPGVLLLVYLNGSAAVGHVATPPLDTLRQQLPQRALALLMGKNDEVCPLVHALQERLDTIRLRFVHTDGTPLMMGGSRLTVALRVGTSVE